LRVIGPIVVHAPLNVLVAFTTPITLLASATIIRVSLFATSLIRISLVTLIGIVWSTASVARVTIGVARGTIHVSWIGIAISGGNGDTDAWTSCPPRPGIPPAAVVIPVSSVAVVKTGAMYPPIVDPYTPVYLSIGGQLKTGSGRLVNGGNRGSRHRCGGR